MLYRSGAVAYRAIETKILADQLRLAKPVGATAVTARVRNAKRPEQESLRRGSATLSARSAFIVELFVMGNRTSTSRAAWRKAIDAACTSRERAGVAR